MEFDLRISKDLVKEAVCEKTERFMSLPMILQTVEANNRGNDRLIKELDYIMSVEFEKIENEISKNISKEKNPEDFKKAMMGNTRIYKENLKKMTKLMGKLSNSLQKKY